MQFIYITILLHMKFSSYRNNSHIHNWVSFTYFITARYKSTKYVMNRDNTVSTNIIKILGLYFHITVIVNLKVKSYLMSRNWHEPSDICQSVGCLFFGRLTSCSKKNWT